MVSRLLFLSDMNPTIDQVQGAIDVLFVNQNATASQRKEASQWLEQFQKTVLNN
jgi:hypothetical protein